MKFEEAYSVYSPYWNNGKRFFHTKEKHLDVILRMCNTTELKYFALFHDIVYIPGRRDNEDKSLAAFKSVCHDFSDLTDPVLVEDMILATKQPLIAGVARDQRIKRAVDIDMQVLRGTFRELLAYEDLIFKEFQAFSIDDYVEGRINFLREHLVYNEKGISALIDFISHKRYSIGVYPGSFDPFHVGHRDILEKAEKVFDKVIVVRANNPDKGKKEYDMPLSLPNEISNHTGLITHLFPEKSKHRYTIIRGIRSNEDVVNEKNYMDWITEFRPDIGFVYIMCDSSNAKMSSSALRSLVKSGCEIDKWVVK